MPDWGMDLLKLLFGQLGVVGTVCFIAAGYLARLHWYEREDHKATRVLLGDLAEKQLNAQVALTQSLSAVETLLEVMVNRKRTR